MRKSLVLYSILFGVIFLTLVPLAAAQPAPAYDSEEITISTNGYVLAGTLLLPQERKRPVPAAIMITGSGLQDRDGQLAGLLNNYRPFKQIAEELAGRGVAVLRVDDRGMGASTGRETLMNATTSTLADDTRAQITFLRQRREIDPQRIALVGHSEGGAIALMIAAGDPNLRAIVLMAAMGKTGKEVNLAQQEQALADTPGLTEEKKAELRAQQREIIRTIMEGGDTSKLPAVARIPWFKEFLTYDPLKFMRKVRQPVLILQGELDRQVTADQATLLDQAARESGNKNVTLRIFPKLNHLFLPATTGAVSEYQTLTTTVVPKDVLETLAAWSAKTLRAGK